MWVFLLVQPTSYQISTFLRVLIFVRNDRSQNPITWPFEYFFLNQPVFVYVPFQEFIYLYSVVKLIRIKFFFMLSYYLIGSIGTVVVSLSLLMVLIISAISLLLKFLLEVFQFYWSFSKNHLWISLISFYFSVFSFILFINKFFLLWMNLIFVKRRA